MAVTAEVDVRQNHRHRRAAWWLAVPVCALVAVGVHFALVAVHSTKRPPVVLAGYGFDALAITPNGRTLYAAALGKGGDDNTDAHTVTPVATASGQAGKPIHVGGVPIALAVTPDDGVLYILLGDGAIASVNPATGRAMATIRLTSGASSMALSPDGRTLYVGTNSNEVVAVHVATGQLGRPVPVPHSPSATAVTPIAMTVSPDGGTLYVADSDDAVIPVNLTTDRPGRPINVGGFPLAIPIALAITPDGRTLYVGVNGDDNADSSADRLVAINTAANTLGTTIRSGLSPLALAVTPDGRTLYVLNADNTLTPVSTASDSPGRPINTAGLFTQPGTFGLAVTPDGRTVYLAGEDVAAIRLAETPS